MQTPNEIVHNQELPFMSNIGIGGFTEEKSVLKNIEDEKRKLRCTICNQAQFLTGNRMSFEELAKLGSIFAYTPHF